MRIHKLTALLGIGAEEEQVDLVQFGFIGKGKLGLALESAMHLMYLLTAVTATCNEYQMYVGVIKQQTDKFTARETRTFNNSCLYHSVSKVFISGMMRSN